MTKEEFFDKYGNIEVKFYSYYKYTFKYHATLSDGNRLVVYFGGDSIDIYRHEVDTYYPITVNVLLPNGGEVYSSANDGTIIESFYD